MESTTVPETHRAEIIKDLVTNKHLARILGVTRATLDTWRDRGCPYVRVEGDDRPSIRFRLEDVVKWARANGRKVPPMLRLPRTSRSRGLARPNSAT